MNFVNRLTYFSGGFIIGLLFLMFFLSGKRTSCSYLPDARVKKDILKNLGIEENITSPTFSIVNQYSTSDLLINHFDLYRVKSLKELDVIGFEEYLDNEGISFIEWPEIAMSKISYRYIEIYIKFIDEKSREITLK